MASATIAELNDAFRTTFSGGMVCLTQGIQALEPSVREKLLNAVQSFVTFEPDNDPYDEHDFGSITLGEVNAFWKIDTYDNSLEFGSSDATSTEVTTRVLTVMLAEEY